MAQIRRVDYLSAVNHCSACFVRGKTQRRMRALRIVEVSNDLRLARTLNQIMYCPECDTAPGTSVLTTNVEQGPV